MNAVRRLCAITLIALSSMLTTNAQPSRSGGSGISIGDLTPGKEAHGFRAAALYVDNAGAPMGARFIHTRTGFTFDLLQIQSVPQAFVWVNSFPTSDMGEPHTQEHLLLGKGTKGRSVANLEDMSLATSSAFTQQLRTCYHFNTAAGPDVYYTLFEESMDALLHPDYTDEEIRREVRNFGVAQNPKDGSMRLEEKGTVYNEMVSTFERSWTRLWREMGRTAYGEGHPLSYTSGGHPAAIREMKPEDIRKFHRENYHLGNMGMIGSFPKEMRLDDILRRTGEILVRLEPTKENRPVSSEENLPAPKMAPAGRVTMVEYPFKSDQQPGPIAFAWQPTLKLEPRDLLLLELFIDNIAGDPSTNLYKRFIDTKTREVDLGAQGVFGWVSDDLGSPIILGLDEVPSANMTEEKMKLAKEKIIEEIARIAAYRDGSPELAEFNERIRSRVIGRRRTMDKFVNSPPGFGFRGTGGGWMEHLDQLAKSKEFKKSVTMKPELEFVEELIAGKKNVWRDLIASWKLLQGTPYTFAALPSPALLAREEQERTERNTAEIARLKKEYGTTDDQETIRRYGAAYDATTAELEALTTGDRRFRFVDAPPLTLDNALEYATRDIRGVKMVASTFDNMTSATVGLALRLDETPQSDLLYLSLLPALMSQTGVIMDGGAVPYEKMSEMLRQQILGLDVYYSTNNRTRRAELVVRGAGNNLAESQRAVEWMRTVLTQPDWRTENLPRIRDLVDQQLSSLRSTMQGREEAWVNNPSGAYYRQDNQLILTTTSFLTRTHNVHRLRWQLKDAGAPADASAISSFLKGLAGAGSASRVELNMLLDALQGQKAGDMSASLRTHLERLEKLSPAARALMVEAAKDIDQTLPDIPDESLRTDWAYLCAQIEQDLMMPPATALARLNETRARLLKSGNARMFMIGSRENQTKLGASINALLGTLQQAPSHPVTYSSERLVVSRLRQRAESAGQPVYVGLVNPNTGSGVFLNSAPLTSYSDLDRASLLRYLASKLYAGGGAHGVFMKTWGAGLAYSNGLGSSPASGRQNYYAERCPELPQTLRFVIDELKRAPRDTGLVEYAIAQAFTEFRTGSSYESRGESMASDLADGFTPEVVSRFRQEILKLRSMPGLTDALYDRMHDVYGTILPGYNVKGSTVNDAVYFVIGPEKQFVSYEEYLKSVEGPETKLHRLYPRDFWMPMEGTIEANRGN